MATNLKKGLSQGFASNDMILLSTQDDQAIIVRERELLIAGDDRDNPNNLWPVCRPIPKLMKWFEKSLQHPVELRPGIQHCRMKFGSSDDAALFKMFWL